MTPTTLPTDAEPAAVLAGSGWAVVEGFLPEPEWRELAAEGRTLWEAGAFRQAGVGRDGSFAIHPEVRNDRVCWLDPGLTTPARQNYLNRIEQLRLALNQTLYLGLFDFEAHFAVYPPGSFYRRHLDRFRNAEHRLISCILYLNADWRPEHGGALRLYPGDGSHRDILPAGGTLVAFHSERFEHEVLAATRERMSLTGWLCRRR